MDERMFVAIYACVYFRNECVERNENFILLINMLGLSISIHDDIIKNK